MYGNHLLLVCHITLSKYSCTVYGELLTLPLRLMPRHQGHTPTDAWARYPPSKHPTTHISLHEPLLNRINALTPVASAGEPKKPVKNRKASTVLKFLATAIGSWNKTKMNKLPMYTGLRPRIGSSWSGERNMAPTPYAEAQENAQLEGPTKKNKTI